MILGSQEVMIVIGRVNWISFANGVPLLLKRRSGVSWIACQLKAHVFISGICGKLLTTYWNWILQLMSKIFDFAEAKKKHKKLQIVRNALMKESDVVMLINTL